MSSDEILVEVKGVSKKYCKDLKRSLRYGLQDLAEELLLKEEPKVDLRRQEFWALQDVNFELRRGESFGVIGVNGSGKTTLLKLMQGLIKPTTGSITIRGKLGALITLGAGFQPLLTGRENIYINAAILGVPRRTVDENIGEILDFAELGDFIDAPVKNYSSGMKGRLGFSIATNLIDPDVLLLDEVLATGDWKFKERCFRRMEEIVQSGATIVFVSHLVPKVEQLCNRAILLHKGVVKMVGDASAVCEAYYEMPDTLTRGEHRAAKRRRRQLVKALKQSGPETTPLTAAEADDPEAIEITQVQLLNGEGQPCSKFSSLDPLQVQIDFVRQPQVKQICAAVQLLLLGDEICISYADHRLILADPALPTATPCQVSCFIPELPLREGKYRLMATLTVPVEDSKATADKATQTVSLTVIAGDQAGIKSTPGLIHMAASWSDRPVPSVATVE
ncbi:MAG: polysaccharide ABC transporter ATP-binding protein [Cyanobacteria bacterium P01_A01_bin.135]